MMISYIAMGVVVGGFTVLLLLMYISHRTKHRRGNSTDKRPQYECKVCGFTTKSCGTAKGHAVGSHNAITEETWTDIIREVW